MSGTPTTALFWDIDGTLLTTDRAGIYALEDAAHEVTGKRVDLDGFVGAGRTEHAIARDVLGRTGAQPDADTIDRFLRAYERRLPEALPRRAGRVLPGIREVLEDLDCRAEVRSFLLTGNTPAGARAKLAHYGLLDFFSAGAYCIDDAPRAEIARRAVALAPEAGATYIIGDTPHDIDCGKAIGARTIALATGSYSREQLAAHRPWRLFDSIPDPESFRQLITGDSEA
jgi:phosphoglycolate phosphatase-like HAD superfamily hydrolase